jgi:hypothetical protein
MKSNPISLLFSLSSVAKSTKKAAVLGSRKKAKKGTQPPAVVAAPAPAAAAPKTRNHPMESPKNFEGQERQGSDSLWYVSRRLSADTWQWELIEAMV